jgi:hypothetical protein
MRHWVDNTGSFTCQARLIRVADGNVKLLKTNGHTSTVPMVRLSQLDLDFVNRQARALGDEAVSRTAGL